MQSRLLLGFLVLTVMVLVACVPVPVQECVPQDWVLNYTIDQGLYPSEYNKTVDLCAEATTSQACTGGNTRVEFCVWE